MTTPTLGRPSGPALPIGSRGTPEDPAKETFPAPGSFTQGATQTPSTPSDTDDALGIIRALFTDVLGGSLEPLVLQAWQDYNRGVPIEIVIDNIRKSDVYAARFTGMAELAKKGRRISEAAYLDLERRYVEVARAFDLPKGFFDSPDDFGRLIGAETSPAEYERRLTAWQRYERQNRDPEFEAEVRRRFEAFGVPLRDSYFLAAALDPQRAASVIERDVQAAEVGAAARRAGYGELTIQQGDDLAGLGVEGQAASQVFGQLADSTELFSSLSGEVGGDVLSRDEQIGAGFGTDMASRRRLETQRRRRQSTFAGGGGIAAGREGLSALGGV